MLNKALTTAAAGAATGAAGALYVEDVFSTWLYTGTGSTQTITNGIDLSGEGGMVWVKSRPSAYDHHVYDTERGAGKYLIANGTNPETDTGGSSVSAFNSDGFSLSGAYNSTNRNNTTYASWTFRKAEKFFDVVTWTGDGATSRYIDHSLDAIPGCIIVKKTNTTSDWYVWHRSGTNTTGRYCALLNSTATYTDQGLGNIFGSGSVSYTPTSTQIRVASGLNVSGTTYVAYVFAHDAGGFGDDETESVIKCGSFTSNASGFFDVNLGWEPQWILIKASSTTGDWFLLDTMRGLSRTNVRTLRANTTGTDINYAAEGYCFPYASGFASTNNFFGGSTTFIYIAIRRGPMKTPTDATKVFSVQEPTGNGSATTITTGFPVDLTFAKAVSDSSASWWWVDRLRGETKYLSSNNGLAEATYSSNPTELDNNTGVVDKNYGSTTSVFADYFFRRAPGFFDVVAYTGTGSTLTVSHNLGVAPELTILKLRSGSAQWFVDSVNTNNRGELDSTTAFLSGLIFNNGVTASSISTTFTGTGINASGSTYIAYLFATLSGVSKVGSYTGTGTTLSIDCGFASGARFVMIKRTDSSGDWYVWDTARGIVSGNDPYLLLNSTAAEVTSTDYIDPLSSGFQISSSAPAAINDSGGSYIFLAIA